VRLKPAEQFNGLFFDVRGTVEKIGNIIVGTICTHGTSRETGEARLAKLCIK
jgi:hypothetical protein